MILGLDWKILWVSEAMAKVARGGVDEHIGEDFDKLDVTFRDKRTFLVSKLMKPIADEYGHATAWFWMKSPDTGHLQRILVTLRLLPEKCYGLGFMYVEDETARTFIRQVGEYFYDVSGIKFTDWELELVDLYIGGMSYEQLAEALNVSPPIIRRRLNKLARQADCESPAQFKERFWGRHAEESIPSTGSVVPGFPYVTGLNLPENL